MYPAHAVSKTFKSWKVALASFSGMRLGWHGNGTAKMISFILSRSHPRIKDTQLFNESAHNCLCRELNFVVGVLQAFNNGITLWAIQLDKCYFKRQL